MFSRIPTKIGKQPKEDSNKSKQLAVVTSGMLQEHQNLITEYNRIKNEHEELKSNFHDAMSVIEESEDTINNILVQHNDEFREAASKFEPKLQILFNNIVSKVDEQERSIAMLISVTQKFPLIISKYQNRISELTIENQRLITSSSSLVDSSVMNNVNLELSNAKSQIESLQQTIVSKDRELQMYKDSLTQYSLDKTNLQKQIADLNETMLKKDSSYTTLALENESINKKLADFNNQIILLTTERDSSLKQLQTATSSINNLNIELLKAKSQSEVQNTIINKITIEKETSIKQMIEKRDEIQKSEQIKTDQLNQQISSLKSELNDAKSKLTVLSQEKETLTNQINEKEKLIKQLSEKTNLTLILSQERESLLKQITEKDSKINQLFAENIDIKKQIEERTNELQSMHNDVNNLNERIIQLTNERNSSVDQSNKQIVQLTSEKEAAIKQIEEKNLIISKMSLDKELAAQKIEEQNNIINKLYLEKEISIKQAEDNKNEIISKFTLEIQNLNNEKSQLLQQIQNLTNEKEILSKKSLEIQTLSNDKTQLLQQIQNLTNEKELLSKKSLEIQTLNNDKAQLLQQIQNLTNEKELLSKKSLEVQILTNDKSQLLQQIQNLTTEKELLSKKTLEIQSLNNDKNQLLQQIQNLTNEKDLLNDNLNKLTEERNSLIKQLAQRAENDTLSKVISERYESLTKEKESISNSLAIANHEKESLQSKIISLEATVSKLNIEKNSLENYRTQIVEKVNLENEQLKNKIKEIENNSVLELKELEIKLNQKVKEAENAKNILSIEKESLTSQLNSKFEEIQKLTKLSEERLDKIHNLELRVESKGEQESLSIQQLKIRISDLESMNMKLREDNDKYVKIAQESNTNYTKISTDYESLRTKFDEINKQKIENEMKLNDIEPKYNALKIENESLKTESTKLMNESDDAKKLKIELLSVKADVSTKARMISENNAKIDEITKQNNLLVARYKESETKIKELEQRNADIKNSTSLTIADLKGKIDDYEQEKANHAEILKQLRAVVAEKDELKHELDDARLQIKELTIKSSKSQREFFLEEENKDLRDRLASSDMMLTTYTQLNSILDGRVKQQNEAMSRLPSAPSTPLVRKSSIGVSPLKIQNDVTLTVTESNDNDYEQQISILNESLKNSHKEILRLQDDLSISKMKNVEAKIDKKKVKIEMLKKELEDLKAKYDELMRQNISLVESQKKSAQLSAKCSSAELRARNELANVQSQLSVLMKMMTSSNLNSTAMKMIDSFSTFVSNIQPIEQPSKEMMERFAAKMVEMFDSVESQLFQKVVILESAVRGMIVRVNNLADIKAQRKSIQNRNALTPTRMKAPRMRLMDDEFLNLRNYT